MQWNNKYSYPKSTISIFKGSRHYSINQENLPSVTTILKATESEEKKIKLEEAMTVVDKFGTDARSISRTLENIKDPEQVEKAVQTENVEKFVERNKQLKN